MALLNRYIEVLETCEKVEDFFIPAVEKVVKAPDILSDAKMITLSQDEPLTKDLLSIYNMSNYRRKISMIMLNPQVDVIIDELIFNHSEVGKCTIS